MEVVLEEASIMTYFGVSSGIDVLYTWNAYVTHRHTIYLQMERGDDYVTCCELILAMDSERSVRTFVIY